MIVLFCRTINKAVREIKYIFYHYYKALGQLINYHKLIAQFSIGRKMLLKQILWISFKFKIRELLIIIWDALILTTDAHKRIFLELEED